MKRNNQNHSNEFFDEYQRYQIVADTVNFYRRSSTSTKYHILEIGSNKLKHLNNFLPDDEVLYSDVELDQEMQQDPQFMEIDGTAIPFENNSFDFVVAIDVLEHIPREKRSKLLEEAFRVAKYAAIVTFPYNSSENISAEARINAYYKALKGEDYIWIKEHQKYGLPELQEIEQVLTKLKCNFFHLLCGNIVLWEKLYYSFFSALDHYAEWEFRKQIDHLYFDVLYNGDWSDSCYRAVYVLTYKENKDLNIYLESQRKPLTDKEWEILDMLLGAQKVIHAREENAIVERELSEKTRKIQELEHIRASILESWKNDVTLWQNDNTKNLSIISTLSLEKKHLQNELNESQKQVEQLNKAMHTTENQNLVLLAHLNDLQLDLEEHRKQENSLRELLMDSETKLEAEQLEKEYLQKQYDDISRNFFWRISKPIRVILSFCKSLFQS